VTTPLLDQAAVLLDQHDAARFLRSSRTTLFRLRRTGQLEAVNHGGRVMYRRSDLERLRLEGWDVPREGWNGNNAPDPYGRLTQDRIPK